MAWSFSHILIAIVANGLMFSIHMFVVHILLITLAFLARLHFSAEEL